MGYRGSEDAGTSRLVFESRMKGLGSFWGLGIGLLADKACGSTKDCGPIEERPASQPRENGPHGWRPDNRIPPGTPSSDSSCESNPHGFK